MVKYIGMFLYDEDDEDHPKRKIKQLKWFAQKSATAAGWTVDTVDANSHGNPQTYLILKADGTGRKCEADRWRYVYLYQESVQDGPEQIPHHKLSLFAG